jgi:enterochelin esterase family protein
MQRTRAAPRTAEIAQHLAPAATAGKEERPPASPTRQASDSGREFVIGPNYRSSRETKPGPEVPRGAVHPLTMRSEDSAIYPGIAKDPSARDQIPKECFTPYLNCPPGVNMSLDEVVPYERKLAVYVPPGNDPSVPAPFIVLNDAMGVDLVPPTLDTLIAEQRVPANLCAIFLASGGDDAQGSQRGLEYDTVDGVFAEFLATEVVPFVEESVGISLTRDPEGRATLGGSSGGSCAFSCAWFRPDLFRRVITYSGTFVNQQYVTNSVAPATHIRIL